MALSLGVQYEADNDAPVPAFSFLDGIKKRAIPHDTPVAPMVKEDDDSTEPDANDGLPPFLAGIRNRAKSLPAAPAPVVVVEEEEEDDSGLPPFLAAIKNRAKKAEGAKKAEAVATTPPDDGTPPFLAAIKNRAKPAPATAPVDDGGLPPFLAAIKAKAKPEVEVEVEAAPEDSGKPLVPEPKPVPKAEVVEENTHTGGLSFLDGIKKRSIPPQEVDELGVAVVRKEDIPLASTSLMQPPPTEPTAPTAPTPQVQFAGDPPAPPKSPFSDEIASIKFTVTKVKYPAERLSRRIQIWYCSSGFSLSTEEEAREFVLQLEETGDAVLKQFATEKFDNITDWANLLEILRKYEANLLINEALEHEDLAKSWIFNVKAFDPVKNVVVEFNLRQSSNLSSIAKELSTLLSLPEAELAAQLPQLLTAEGNNPMQQSMELLKDDLIFAEDLILYQEEVVEHLWGNYSLIKKVVEAKDDVINDLYKQMSDLKDELESLRSEPVRHEVNYGTQPPPSSSYRGSPPNYPMEEVKDTDEYKEWMDEKAKLVKSHTDERVILVNEIRSLRKTLEPKGETALQELRRNEQIRQQIEEELGK